MEGATLVDCYIFWIHSINNSTSLPPQQERFLLRKVPSARIINLPTPIPD